MRAPLLAMALVLAAGIVGGGARLLYERSGRPERSSAQPPALVAPPLVARDSRPAGDLGRTERTAPSLSGTIVALDPGHNGGNARHPAAIGRLVDAGGFRKACDTTGAQTADGDLTEARFNLDVVLRLRRALRRRGARVVLTRETNDGTGPCIDRRARIGNEARADVALSIHADGGPPTGRGFHVIHPRSVPGLTEEVAGPSLRLARDVRSRLRELGLSDSDYAGSLGLHARRDIGGLNLSEVPKVLVEVGNMRNAEDAHRLEDPAHRGRMAEALAGAIEDFLGG